MVRDFHTPLSEMDESRRQKISKDIVKLNNTIHQLNIVNIYRLLHSTIAGYTFFLILYGTLPKTDHTVGRNT